MVERGGERREREGGREGGRGGGWKNGEKGDREGKHRVRLGVAATKGQAKVEISIMVKQPVRAVTALLKAKL